MKVFVALACVIVCCQASYLAPAPVKLSSGTSQSSRSQDSAGNYAFQYTEQHSTGGSSRSESGNGWNVAGSYSLNVGDGRQRLVKYVADGAGFRAAIATNEPGTAAAPAASTSISSPYAPPQPVQPLPAPVAVAPVAIAAPEPVAIAAPLAPALAIPALHAPLPEPVALAPVAHAVPVVKAVPAVSSYSTSINHVAPAPAVAIAAPLPLPAAPIAQLRGWN